MAPVVGRRRSQRDAFNATDESIEWYVIERQNTRYNAPGRLDAMTTIWTRLLCLAGVLPAAPVMLASGPPVISDDVKTNVRARVLGGESAGIAIGMVNRYGKVHYAYGEMVRGTGDKIAFGDDGGRATCAGAEDGLFTERVATAGQHA